jgi:hypothetical protein
MVADLRYMNGCINDVRPVGRDDGLLHSHGCNGQFPPVQDSMPVWTVP